MEMNIRGFCKCSNAVVMGTIGKKKSNRKSQNGLEYYPVNNGCD